CFPTLANSRRKRIAEGGAPIFVRELTIGPLRIVLSHPCDKNKYVARMGTRFSCYLLLDYSMRRALTGSIEAARLAGMMPAMAAATARTRIAPVITTGLTLVMS